MELFFKVTRFCCIECRAIANGTKRKRIVHADHLSKEAAEQMAKNWSSYAAKVEPDLKS